LDPEDRRAAPCVPIALASLRAAFAAGERAGAVLTATARAVVAAEPRARLEYVVVVDATELTPVDRVTTPAVVVIAVWFGPVRLIDNLVLDPSAVGAPAAPG
jgi:pantoate--beta-alanine ligase